MKPFLLALSVLLSAAAACAQGSPGQSNYPISGIYASGAPSGTCPGQNIVYIDSATGNLYTCPTAGGSWVLTGGGGTTSYPLTMNNSGSGASSGATFDGSAAKTLSYNTLGAAPTASPSFSGTVTLTGTTDFPSGTNLFTPASGNLTWKDGGASSSEWFFIAPVDTNAHNAEIIFNAPSAGGIQIKATGSTSSSYLYLTGGGEGVYVGSGDAFVPGGSTVSNLPAASSFPGGMVQVTDSTSISAEGQTCVGGSTNIALAFSNGSTWKCF